MLQGGISIKTINFLYDVVSPPRSHSSIVFSSVIDETGQWAATLDDNGLLKFWNLETGQLIFTRGQYIESQVVALIISPIETIVVSEDTDDRLTAFDFSGNILWTKEIELSTFTGTKILVMKLNNIPYLLETENDSSEPILRAINLTNGNISYYNLSKILNERYGRLKSVSIGVEGILTELPLTIILNLAITYTKDEKEEVDHSELMLVDLENQKVICSKIIDDETEYSFVLIDEDRKSFITIELVADRDLLFSLWMYNESDGYIAVISNRVFDMISSSNASFFGPEIDSCMWLKKGKTALLSTVGNRVLLIKLIDNNNIKVINITNSWHTYFDYNSNIDKKFVKKQKFFRSFSNRAADRWVISTVDGSIILGKKQLIEGFLSKGSEADKKILSDIIQVHWNLAGNKAALLTKRGTKPEIEIITFADILNKKLSKISISLVNKDIINKSDTSDDDVIGLYWSYDNHLILVLRNKIIKCRVIDRNILVIKQFKIKNINYIHDSAINSKNNLLFICASPNIFSGRKMLFVIGLDRKGFSLQEIKTKKLKIKDILSLYYSSMIDSFIVLEKEAIVVIPLNKNSKSFKVTNPVITDYTKIDGYYNDKKELIIVFSVVNKPLIIIYNKTTKRITKLKVKSPFMTMNCIPNSYTILTANYYGSLTLIDRSNKTTVINDIDSGQPGVINFAFSPDGKYLLTLGVDYSLKLWSITDRKK